MTIELAVNSLLAVAKELEVSITLAPEGIYLYDNLTDLQSGSPVDYAKMSSYIDAKASGDLTEVAEIMDDWV